MKRNRWLGTILAALLAVGAAATATAEWNKGLEAYRSQDYATAVAEFEGVTQTNPDYAGAYYMLGLSQRAMGKVSQALGNLRKAVELEGDNVSYKVALGQALVQADQFQEAYGILKPLDINAMDASFRSAYALLFAQAATKVGQPGDAVRVLRGQVGGDSRNAKLHKALGVAQSDLGNHAEAYSAFRRAYELDGSDDASARSAVYAAINTARTASGGERQRWYSQGAAVAEKLAGASPEFEHLLLAGETQLGAKQYSKALGWFERAQQKQPQNALVRYYAAQAQTSLDRLDDALASLQQALKIGVEGKLRQQVYNQGGFVYDKKKDYDKAVQWYQEAGNTRMVNEVRNKQEMQARNREHEQECREFKSKIDALRVQIEELEKLGESAQVEQLREQLPVLERQYQQTCG